MGGSDSSPSDSTRDHQRSLPVNEWSDADRRAWEDACRPGARLKPGGAASYLAEVSRGRFALAFTAVFWISYICWIIGSYANFAVNTQPICRNSGSAGRCGSRLKAASLLP